jgi:hypothetical protein
LFWGYAPGRPFRHWRSAQVVARTLLIVLEDMVDYFLLNRGSFGAVLSSKIEIEKPISGLNKYKLLSAIYFFSKLPLY